MPQTLHRVGEEGRGRQRQAGWRADRDGREAEGVWNARTASCVRPMRSCARPPHILPRRSSTARSSDDRLHRRASQGLWGRADLPGPADRPIDLSRARRQAARSLVAVPRARRDQELKPEMTRVFAENFAVYGVRKVWRQMRREGFDIARCTVERLMRDRVSGRDPGQAGAHHDQRQGRAVSARPGQPAVPCAAPNRLWVSDFTYVATWAGFVYVAFVIDVYAGGSSAGGSAERRTPASCWMRWSRRSMIGCASHNYSVWCDHPGQRHR